MNDAFDLVASEHGAAAATGDAAAEVSRLRRENEQLRAALESRIVIEQAKGVLAERFAVAPEQAFELLRRAARSEGMRLHDLAADVVGGAQTPPPVARELRRRGAPA